MKPESTAACSYNEQIRVRENCLVDCHTTFKAIRAVCEQALEAGTGDPQQLLIIVNMVDAGETAATAY